MADPTPAEVHAALAVLAAAEAARENVPAFVAPAVVTAELEAKLAEMTAAANVVPLVVPVAVVPDDASVVDVTPAPVSAPAEPVVVPEVELSWLQRSVKSSPNGF